MMRMLWVMMGMYVPFVALSLTLVFMKILYRRYARNIMDSLHE